MLRQIQVGLARPVSYPVDPNATFEPGMIAQLKLVGNEVVMGVSDGVAPIGIIDDIKSMSLVRPVVDEIVIIKAGAVSYNTTDGYTTTYDITGALQNAAILPMSFSISVAGLDVGLTNGIVVAHAGTPLNHTLPGSSTPNAIKALASYSHYIPNMPGDDSTLGSGQISVWIHRGIYQTDQYETGVPYQLNAVLFVSPSGKLTSIRTLPNQPGVAQVVVPPTALNTLLEFFWI